MQISKSSMRDIYITDIVAVPEWGSTLAHSGLRYTLMHRFRFRKELCIK
jgi:hypothetical protein